MEVNFAQCQHGQEEIDAVNRVLKGHWLASGQENEQFEIEFAAYHNRRHAVCVNSGSMANLIALAALELPKGSKVVTSACGFPSTLAPILHLGLTPILVDYDLNTLNIDLNQITTAILTHSPKALIFAHTLGNPVNVTALKQVCLRYNVAMIEDCCESLGASFYDSPVGGSSDLATYSFYPSHQITALGGGGMITTDSTELSMKLRSLRDWGKVWYWNDKLGQNNTKFDNSVDGINYFQHYIYDTLGYNAKLPEANAAFGRVQLGRLNHWVIKRQANYNYLRNKLDSLHEYISFPLVNPNSTPSWFAFPIVLNGVSRDKLCFYLEFQGIRTRPFFAGNITRHTPYKEHKAEFPVADKLMKDALFIGLWQGLEQEDLDYMVDHIIYYVNKLGSLNEKEKVCAD